jgi:hypothetical protein
MPITSNPEAITIASDFTIANLAKVNGRLPSIKNLKEVFSLLPLAQRA